MNQKSSTSKAPAAGSFARPLYLYIAPAKVLGTGLHAPSWADRPRNAD
jgi:hypothetical protein